MDLEFESDQEEQTRCVCGRDDLPGTMIQCEQCHAWQHTDCMNLGRKLPKNYYCEECRPTGHPFYELFMAKNPPRKTRNTLNSRIAQEPFYELDRVQEAIEKVQSPEAESESVDLPPQSQTVSQKSLKTPKSLRKRKKKKIKIIPMPEIRKRVQTMLGTFNDHQIDDQVWEDSDVKLKGSIDVVSTKVFSALKRFEESYLNSEDDVSE